MTAADVQCIYPLQEGTGNAIAVGAGCPELVAQNSPVQGATCTLPGLVRADANRTMGAPNPGNGRTRGRVRRPPRRWRP